MDSWEERVNKILDRMREAHLNERGVKLSPQDIQDLSITLIGELWQQPASTSQVEKESK